MIKKQNILLAIKYNYVLSARLFIVCFFLIVGLVGCASSSRSNSEEGYSQSASNSSESLPSSPQTAESYLSQFGVLYPWEIPMFADLQSGSGSVFVYADEFYRNKNYTESLKLYRTLYGSVGMGQPLEEQIKYIRRITGNLLSFGKSDEAINTISNFFKNNSISSADVQPIDCLLLAYSYGQARNTDQTLAWLSRAYSDKRANDSVKLVASEGVRSFIRSIPEENFEMAAQTWRGTQFIASLFGADRAIRQRVTLQNVASYTENPFAVRGGTLLSNQDDLLQNPSYIIAAVLPLSGKYSQLGISTKNGIERALEEYRQSGGAGTLKQISVEFHDHRTDIADASILFRNFIVEKKANLVIGPLIAEAADDFSRLTSELQIPIITLSKRDAFTTGGSVLRLGATARSQASSLINIALSQYSISKFGIIWSDDVTQTAQSIAIKEELNKSGHFIQCEASYNSNDLSSLTAIATQIEQCDIQALIVLDKLSNASRFFSLLSEQKRAKIRPFGFLNWDNKSEMTQSAAIMNGAVYISPFYSESKKPEVLSFIEQYKAQYGKKPDFLAAQGYDVTKLVLQAIASCNILNGEQFLQCLTNINTVTGLTGLLSTNQSGEIERKFYGIEFKDGAFVELE
jgi:branched-chain amino acid transport system substrate-binding protein